MSTAHVTVIIDGHWRGFDRDDLETAWLVRADVDSAYQTSRDEKAVRRLVDEMGWPESKAVGYVIAASNWDGKD